MSLYLQLRDQLLREIIRGTFAIGDTLPSEHELSEQYQVSRVTVRKALDLLKQDGLLSGVPRQGTTVIRRKGGFRASLDLIALIASVHDPFFATFMQYFERTAEDHGSLMLFKQDYQGQAYNSDELFYRFLKKDIRNIVFWPQTADIDFDLLKRMRAVGMNFVFFDQGFESPVADAVCLDNTHAVQSLYQALEQDGCRNIGYIGYSELPLPSNLRREQAFRELAKDDKYIYRLTWQSNIDDGIEHLIDQILHADNPPDALICNSGGIGLATATLLQRRNLQDRIKLGSIDVEPAMQNFPMYAYQQPFQEMATRTYQRLATQNNQGSSWQAGSFLIQGERLQFTGTPR